MNNNSFPGTGPALENQMATADNATILLALYLKNRKAEALNLLKVNGVSLSPLAGNKAITIAFLKAMKDNEYFRNQASMLLTQYVQDMPSESPQSYVSGKRYHNTIGVDEQYIDPNQPWLGTIPISGSSTGAAGSSGTTPAPSGGGGFWGSLGKIFTPDVIGAGIKTGLNALNTSITSKANQTSEQNALEAQQRQIELIQAQAQLKATAAASTPFPTWLKVTLGLAGVGVMATVIIVLVRRRGKAKAA